MWSTRLFMSRPAALRGCPCTLCLPQGCGPGIPGPYAKRPPFDKGGFSLLAHFSIFFCPFGTFFDYFAQIGCFCGSYYTIMIKYRRMYIFTARLLRL